METLVTYDMPPPSAESDFPEAICASVKGKVFNSSLLTCPYFTRLCCLFSTGAMLGVSHLAKATLIF